MTCTETRRDGVPRLRVGLGGRPRAVMNATKATRQQTPVGQKKDHRTQMLPKCMAVEY